MSYAVKEIFYTLQGEGAQAGRPAVFCRFSGCNLWSGREIDRATAVCRFCDTDFVGTDGTGGGRFPDAAALAAAVAAQWPAGAGGRPMSYAPAANRCFNSITPLIEALHAAGFEIAIETNGTKPVPEGIDWVCVSPKAGSQLVVERGNELKLVFPQAEPEAKPENFLNLRFDNFFLQPMDGPDRVETLKATIAYCLANPTWRLSLQTHKIMGIP